MKTSKTLLGLLIVILTCPLSSRADELSAEALQGKWIFTRILMDKTREVEVNNPTEFLPDGTAIFYLAPGVERSRGTYTIADNTIIYKDDKGEQVWKLVSFEDGMLHVDHRGAEMFFERQ